MAKYKAYPEYKDSGVEWLGVIPQNWDVARLKHIASIYGRIGFRGYTVDDIVGEGEGAIVLSPSNIVDEKFSLEKKTFLRWEKYFESPEIIVNENDVLLVKTGSTYGKSTIIKALSEPMTINPQMALIKEIVVEPRFLAYWFNTSLIKCKIEIANTGSGMPTMTQENINNFPVVTPPNNLDVFIADFLDHETAKIDNLIEKQQQLIELLKEKRQAVISHAVTKGLNPDVPMKDSGVEWLGKIPKDWQLKQIRHLCTSNGGGTPSKNNPNFWVGNIPWVSPKDMKFQYISDAEDHVSEDAVKQSSTKKIPTGSVLIVVRGMILAHSVPVAINTKVVTINQDMKALVPNENISCDYLHLVLSGLKRTLLELTDNSAHGTKCLRTDLFEKLWIPLPSLKQQKKIISEINEKVIKIDSLIHLQEEAKVLLQERRTALISAAVTGKIDVRDWVAPNTQKAEEPQEATA